jgi:CheY-like chemotaxis protein
VVDDDVHVRTLVKRYLVRSGFKAAACGDGRQAITILRAIDFDLLVTDIHMPDVHGISLLEWVRRIRPHMPVVVITAFGNAWTRRQCARLGVLRIFDKPFDTADLARFIEEPHADTSSSGLIEEAGMVDYVYSLALTRRSAVLELISRDNDLGRVYVVEGEIVHASCEGEHGEEAFFRCMSFATGTYMTLPLTDVPERTVDASTDLLILELARRRAHDPLARIESSVHPSGTDLDDVQVPLPLEDD